MYSTTPINFGTDLKIVIMDPLSIATGAVGFTDVAARLAISCFKLYKFWESLQGASTTVEIIKTDLALLSNVLQDLSAKGNLEPSVTMVLKSCQIKIETLEKIIGSFDIKSVMEASRHERLWAKFQMTSKMKEIEVFRKELSEVRNTLMLGIQKPAMCFTNDEVQIVRICGSTMSDTKSQLQNPILTKSSSGPSPPLADSFTPTPGGQAQSPPLTGSGDSSLSAIASSAVVQKFLQHSLHLAVDDLFASGTVQQLMEASLNKVTSFDAVHTGSYDGDQHDIHRVPVTEYEKSQSKQGNSAAASGQSAAAQETPPRLSRSRTCYGRSSIGVVLGSIWIRTSTLKVAEASSISAGQLEVITSFIFYPASWLSRVGLKYGAEANLQWSPLAGWKFKVATVRAVPENSYIFDFCRDGNVQAVMKLLERGDASLQDTSPKGWTPLHFAAASGQVDLCATLIRKGANKQALAYEGPTENALSPLAIWSEFSHNLTSTQKIEMMRVFGPECLDVSELNADGWVVGHNLIASMGQEQSRMSETSVHWLYSQKQTEILVALGAESVWHGLQQAVRAFLFEEHDNQIISSLLDSGDIGEKGAEYQSHVASMGHWLALRASQRDMIPIAVQAAQLLQIDGYDPIMAAGGLGKRDINRLLPTLYSTWAKKSSNILGSAKEIIKLELEVVLGELCLDVDELAKRVREARDELEAPVGGSEPTRCRTCWDDYTTLGKGLVQPCRIAFDKCREAGHKYNCACSRYLKACGVVPARSVAATGDTDESDVEEEFFQEPKEDIEQLCAEYDQLLLGHEASPPQGDPFYDAAAMLYQSHGRRWIGSYDADETLCAACFLRREEYIGEDGPGGTARFTPAPKTFVSACTPDTFDATYSS
ncbi:hypothetical protein B0T24DRAFT_691791 [Lasiosphaeria ovina]|uniref:Azaphilone pigments biosynthesis cluster protein L N-terminal domain-containing protein n=1 Tax=Lasiosphaeria ovina TaxID=92902 RepID=A0AAE0JSL8_9PEZI|nr:hypothetical protein B0T24DRAFT_691791 [Lasiosphaeria ovina]